jgi:hypothetical protein
MKKLKELINLARRRLAWLLIGKRLLYRLENIESTMDLAEAKINEIAEQREVLGEANTTEKGKTQKILRDEHNTWSSIYFRQHDLHSEMSALVDYLRG